jgi:hypothetical protein
MIILTKDRKIILDNDLNPKHENYERKEIESVIPFLNHTIEIEEGFTLNDFFSIVEKDSELMELVFSSHLGHHSLQPFFDDLKKEKEENSKEEKNKIDFLEVYWSTDLFEDNDGKTDFTFFPGFQGWGKYHKEDMEDKDEPLYGGYAIEFTPLHQIKHLTIKLNKKLKVYKNYKDVIFEAESDFTVYDVFGEILSEVSFCGIPEERDEKLGDLLEGIENMETNFHVLDAEKYGSTIAALDEVLDKKKEEE